MRAFDSGWVAPAGPEIAAFESELASFVGVADVVAMSSGSAALQVALRLAGVQPGDIVIVQTFTFIASANAVIAVGGVPVFIDSEVESWNLSATLLDEALAWLTDRGDRVAAVIAVDLYGRCADYGSLLGACRHHGVPLIEDAAEAIGATCEGQQAGAFGRFGVLSFNGNKIMTTSGGGALLCHDKESAERARYLITQARLPAPHYEHEESGYNYRLSNLLAAMGRSQLRQLSERVERRREIRQRYAAALSEVDTVTVFGHDRDDDNAWLTCILSDGPSPEALRNALECHDIEARPLWKPMHIQPLFAKHERLIDGTSEALFARGLCLPSGSSMTDRDVDRVAEIVLQVASG